MHDDNSTRNLSVAQGATGPDSRRLFLRGATAAALPSLIVATSSNLLAANPKPKPKPKPIPLSSVQVDRAVVRVLIHEIQNDEADHVTILQKLLDDSGNPLTPKIRPTPVLNLSNLVQHNLRSFLMTAAAFENTGSGTYGGALFAVQQTNEYFPTAVGLCTVESRHASFLNALLSQPLVPDFAPVESPIAQGVTLSRVAPFVSDPVVGLPSFDPVNSSDPNNFRILDFLLFLEYIEAAFYRINVPRFFP
ncbi:Ferritin-like domain-containing protein [Singulisphaera sp. GP187]|uniref:ferritin-like domain-containing protein n=1 Tax=Singulisphaera sp. GP187 TaxID=1882752 RepID=UPI000927AA73|nr:ferritin-like domain-containing protein [Singulisphaera sp. GP187]SIO57522.1 Ferritin-like domain-containing protein [Singulisphaera sp. GP187]